MQAVQETRRMLIVKAFVIALEMVLCVGALTVIVLAATGTFQNDDTHVIPTVLPSALPVSQGGA